MFGCGRHTSAQCKQFQRNYFRLSIVYCKKSESTSILRLSIHRMLNWFDKKKQTNEADLINLKCLKFGLQFISSFDESDVCRMILLRKVWHHRRKHSTTLQFHLIQTKHTLNFFTKAGNCQEFWVHAYSALSSLLWLLFSFARFNSFFFFS